MCLSNTLIASNVFIELVFITSNVFIELIYHIECAYRMHLSHYRIDFSHNCIDLSHNRIDLSHNRIDLSHNRIDLSNDRIDLSNKAAMTFHIKPFLFYNFLGPRGSFPSQIYYVWHYKNEIAYFCRREKSALNSRLGKLSLAITYSLT